ncbi:MAG: pectate lyase [Prevotella sp.]|nr:pectate lyase [Prevotella sp.]
MKRNLLLIAMLVLTTIASKAQISDYTMVENELLAFPTARGFGKYATGGRGGSVVEVTNLDDNGQGSLRWALKEAAKTDSWDAQSATIVFRVSGIITLQSDIRAKVHNVTIAGQTAPGEGILIRGAKLNFGGSNDLIIRNIRARLGVKDLERKEGESDTDYKKRCFIAGGSIGIENARNIIIDHCCFGWSGEENMTMYDNFFTTVQWCIVHEGLYDAGHAKGARSYGCQWGGAPATYHHNLLANNYNRTPRINGASNENQDRNVFLEYLNNVNFNWAKANSCYGGENEAGEYSSHECNFVGNFYKAGPARSASNSNYFVEMSAARSGKTLTAASVWYLADNVMPGKDAATNDNWSAINNKTGFPIADMKVTEWRYPSEAYTRLEDSQIDDYDKYRTPVETAEQAYENVLAKVGTVNRDAVEKRVINDVTTGTPKYKDSGSQKTGIIDKPADAEGYQPYAEATPYTDNDHDGMDDEWETANGFDPANAADRNNVVTAEGYTALEVYLCHLMGEELSIITGVANVNTNPNLNLNVEKVISDNQLIIKKASKIYSAAGQQIK